MPLPILNLRVRNNDDWTRGFTLLQGAGIAAPWANVAPYAPGTAYQSSAPASLVQQAGDLYVANPANDPPAWTGAAAFDPAQWLRVGVGASYGAGPFSLEGCTLKMGVQLPATVMTLTSAPGGGLVIFDVPNGGWRFAVPALKARGVPPGAWPYDFLVLKGTQRTTAFAGTLTVTAGATP